MSQPSASILDDDLVILDEVGSDSEKMPSSPEITVLDQSTSKSTTSLPPQSISCAHRQINRLTKNNESLQAEINKLRGFSSLTFGPENQPLVVVHFSTEAISTKYKSQTEKLITTLMKDELEPKSTSTEKSNEFYIDKAGFNSNDRESSSQNDCKYPLYRNEISEVMTDQVDEDCKGSDSKPRNTCFNCLGDHFISDCPKPPNRQNIAQNKQEFYFKMGGKQNRYHCEIEPHLLKFKPGVLSAKLRKALNLGENCLPLHVYRMRVLGYPPGWLCEAQVNSSGITMYDSEGKEITDFDNLEEGEVNEPRSIKIQYDPKKLIEYPGFNTYPEQGTIDECVKLGFPPMQESHLKSTFERVMKPPPATPYKRKKEIKSLPKTKMTRNEVDMEIEDESDEEIRPPGCNRSPPPQPELENSSNQSKETAEDVENNSERNSPSLEDLEDQKQLLIQQLQQATTSKNCSVSESKFVSLGTPVLSGTNSCTKLPDTSKFAATISDHVNFENLPNSTGSYDKMKTLLFKIRQRLT